MRKLFVLLVFALFASLHGLADNQGYAVFDSETSTLTFKYGEKPQGNNVYDTYNASWDRTLLKKVVFDPSYANARPTSAFSW